LKCTKATTQHTLSNEFQSSLIAYLSSSDSDKRISLTITLKHRLQAIISVCFALGKDPNASSLFGVIEDELLPILSYLLCGYSDTSQPNQMGMHSQSYGSIETVAILPVSDLFPICENVFPEVCMLLTFLTFFPHSLSDKLWSMLPLIVSVWQYKSDANDGFSVCFLSLSNVVENYISRGIHSFFSYPYPMTDGGAMIPMHVPLFAGIQWALDSLGLEERDRDSNVIVKAFHMLTSVCLYATDGMIDQWQANIVSQCYRGWSSISSLSSSRNAQAYCDSSSSDLIADAALFSFSSALYYHPSTTIVALLGHLSALESDRERCEAMFGDFIGFYTQHIQSSRSVSYRHCSVLGLIYLFTEIECLPSSCTSELLCQCLSLSVSMVQEELCQEQLAKTSYVDPPQVRWFYLLHD